MKRFGFAVALAGLCLLAGTASAQNRYASRGQYEPVPTRAVSYHQGFNEIESAGCCGDGPSCGAPGCGGCGGGGRCCHPCLLPCVLRGLGRAIDCLLPCGRCCGGGGGCGAGGCCQPKCCQPRCCLPKLCLPRPCCAKPCCAKPCCSQPSCGHGRPALYGSVHGNVGCTDGCGGSGHSFDGDDYSTPYAPPMKGDPFIDDAPSGPTPAKAKSTRTQSRPRASESKTASRSVEREETSVASHSKPIIGTGVAKVVHEEPVTVKKPITSLKKLPRDEAPEPPSLYEVDEDNRTGLPRNPLRR